jgi:1-deoxy-D-xylulose-5-phosphate synthase
VITLAAEHRLVVTVEDNVRVGGVGCVVAQALRDAGVHTPLRDFGIPAEFLDHANRASVLEQVGLTGQRIAHEVVGLVAGLSSAAAAASAGPVTDGAPANGSAPKVTTR